jgi:hypothetical protein
LLGEKGLRTLAFAGDLFLIPFKVSGDGQMIAERPNDIKRWLRWSRP